jgi:hypothetical protein
MWLKEYPNAARQSCKKCALKRRANVSKRLAGHENPDTGPSVNFSFQSCGILFTHPSCLGIFKSRRGGTLRPVTPEDKTK